LKPLAVAEALKFGHQGDYFVEISLLVEKGIVAQLGL